MQPYFLPYIGYWQLLSAVDRFILHDNVQYTKKGWINRNRFLENGKDSLFTVPLKKDSDHEDIVDRSVSEDFDRGRLLNRLSASYRKAPCFGATMPVIERIVGADLGNLFDYLRNSIRLTAEFLEIKTPIVTTSAVEIDRGLRGEDKVLALCEAVGSDAAGGTLTYINPIGGRLLYSRSRFAELGIELRFLQTRPIQYPQYDDPFVPDLSILDVMMFNSREVIRTMLREYDLV